MHRHTSMIIKLDQDELYPFRGNRSIRIKLEPMYYLVPYNTSKRASHQILRLADEQ